MYRNLNYSTSLKVVNKEPKFEMASDPIDNLRYLFMRPGEPMFVQKPDQEKPFRVPKEYLPAQYQEIAEAIFKHYCPDGCPSVEPVANFKDRFEKRLNNCLKLGRDEQFSVFISKHREMAAALIEVLMEAKDCKELVSLASYCRENMNSNMFIYALSVSILHRPDTTGMKLPSLVQVFPNLFISQKCLKQCREELDIVASEGVSARAVQLERNRTATDLDVEHRLAYFREDLGVNLHHHYWHLVYPTDAHIFKKDRRGELFYYMHQQILARYNFERFSNRLYRVTSLSDWGQPIPEGYFSKLGIDTGNGLWPGRCSGTKLRDISTKDDEFTIQDLGRWRDRIYEAIHRGEVDDPNEKEPVKLDEKDGIDILGNIIEASTLSCNKNLYGDLHNKGHMALAHCHDPDSRHLESRGVMGTFETAMRDPVFYRWHSFINDMFIEHKNTLPPYTKDQLDFEGIKVEDFVVIPQQKGDRNTFYTFWKESDVDLKNGLDFAKSTGAALVRFTHLDHKPFRYEIKIDNSSGTEKIGTVRIFMAPSDDERGLPFDLDKQRPMMIEMDKFTLKIPNGVTTHSRESHESSVTIPFENSFPNPDQSGKVETASEEQSRYYCGCGWPQHMLIPKGSDSQLGLSVDLFVMISDYEQDKVDKGPESQAKDCCGKNAVSFCGLKDKLYPDSRSMGYPFDRRLTEDAFSTDNKRVVKMKIISTDCILKIAEPRCTSDLRDAMSSLPECE